MVHETFLISIRLENYLENEQHTFKGENIHMASWDQDIHRIQEIQQLLESRQRFFQGQLSTSFYKVDEEGNPKYFPTLSPSTKTTLVPINASSEPSIGQSLEANAGSQQTDLSEEIRIEQQDAEDDISEGNCADHSQDDYTSQESSDEGTKVRVKKSKKKLKKAGRIRRWVEINTSKSPTEKFHIPGFTSIEKGCPKNPPATATAAVFKPKTVNFEETTPASTEEDELNSVKVVEIKRPKQKSQRADPIHLLKRKSWLLRNEVARRLDDMDIDVDRKSVLHKVTKGTLAFARERLRKAEKSLSSTVRDEQRKSLKPRLTSDHKKTPSALQKPLQQTLRKPLVANKAISRLALRQAEEALKSDLNLREAFALIKIDPDPLLDLASVDKETEDNVKKPVSSKSFGGVGSSSRRISRPRVDSTIFDDPETLGALRRLTKLSTQHKQKQKSLVPERINRTATAIKPASAFKTNSRKDSLDTENLRRASSGGGTSESRSKKSKSVQRSKEFRRNNGPKLAFSGLEASLRAQRSGSDSFGRNPVFGIRVEKLAGTVL